MSFDIASLSAKETIDIEIKDPRTGEALIGDGGKPCSVTTHSPGSKPFAAEQSKASNRAMKRLRAKGKSDTTPEEDAAAKAGFLTGITVSFNNFTYKGGAQGPEMFRSCYLDSAMGWLTDQVNVDAGDWGNAVGAASSN
jgi:hypothetical protein